MPSTDLLDHDRAATTSPARTRPWHARPTTPVVTYRTTLARVGHVVLVAGGWGAFAVLWARVLQRPGALEAIVSTGTAVLGLALVVTAATAVWIQHNVALARRRGGRRSGSPPLVLPERDLLGRVLLVDPGVGEAAVVVVDVDEVGKTFSARSTDG